MWEDRIIILFLYIQVYCDDAADQINLIITTIGYNTHVTDWLSAKSKEKKLRQLYFSQIVE